MKRIQEGDILIFENGTELKVDHVEDYCHNRCEIQYVEGTVGKDRYYTYVDGDTADSQTGLKGRIIKCLRP